MKKLYEELSFFFKQKIYIVCVVITAVLSYGFAITHESIGVDDTVVSLYLENGLEPVMGRWTVFLLNKIFHMGEFAPFITELAGLLLLLLSVVLFCVLFRRIFGEKIGIVGYTIFSCVFLSCPFISEVWVYYYHDGVDIGYNMLALSLLFFESGFESRGKKVVADYLGSMLCAWVAVGCYESFLIFYIYGCIMIVFLRGMVGKEKLTFKHLFFKIGICACLTIACVVMRTIMQQLLIAIFDLKELEAVAKSRDLTGSLVLFANDNWLYDVFMLVKKYWIVYFVNGAIYFPMTVHVLSVAVVGIIAGIEAIRKKNGWFLVLFLGLLVTPMLLTFVELKAPLYRACQYMPFLIATATIFLYYYAQMFVCTVKSLKVKCAMKSVVILFLAALVWNQAFETNRNFYTDYNKYQYEKDILIDVANEVKHEYGEGRIVIFTGKFMPSYELVKDYYAGFSSKKFARISALTDWLDPLLKEKYYSPYGYYFGGEAHYSLIDWGLYAFGHQGQEIVSFLKMHGYSLQTVEDQTIVEKAEKLTEGTPKWPCEGSITEMDGYVIVHF